MWKIALLSLALCTLLAGTHANVPAAPGQTFPVPPSTERLFSRVESPAPTASVVSRLGIVDAAAAGVTARATWTLPEHPTGPVLPKETVDPFASFMPGVPHKVKGVAVVNVMGVRTEAESWLHRNLHPNLIPPTPKAPQPLYYRSTPALINAESGEKATNIPVASLKHTQMDIPDPAHPATQPPSWEILTNPSIPMPPMLSAAPVPPTPTARAAYRPPAPAATPAAAPAAPVRPAAAPAPSHSLLEAQAQQFAAGQFRQGAGMGASPVAVTTTTTYYSNPMNPNAVFPYATQLPYASFYPREVRDIQLPQMPDNTEQLRRSDKADTLYNDARTLPYAHIRDMLALNTHHAPTSEDPGHAMETKSTIGPTGISEAQDGIFPHLRAATGKEIAAGLSRFSKTLVDSATKAKADKEKPAENRDEDRAEGESNGGDNNMDGNVAESSLLEVSAEAETTVDVDAEAEVEAEADLEAEADTEARSEAEAEAELDAELKAEAAAADAKLAREANFLEVSGIAEREAAAAQQRASLLQQQEQLTAGMDLEDALHTMAHGAPAHVHMARLQQSQLEELMAMPEADRADRAIRRNAEMLARIQAGRESEEMSLAETASLSRAPGGNVVPLSEARSYGRGRPIGFPNSMPLREAPFPIQKAVDRPAAAHPQEEQQRALLQISNGRVSAETPDAVALSDPANFQVPDSWFNAPHLQGNGFPSLVPPPRMAPVTPVPAPM